MRSQRIDQLSLGFHGLLVVAALSDIYYGFGMINQWQYWVVSVIMLVCIMVQHLQLLVANKDKLSNTLLCLSGLMLIVGLSYGVVFTSLHPGLWFFILMGWVQRLSYMFHALPQWIKTFKLRCSNALSPWYIGLGIITALCDSVTAWYYHWGPSSRYGAPVSLLIHCALWIQWYMYQSEDVDILASRL